MNFQLFVCWKVIWRLSN